MSSWTNPVNGTILNLDISSVVMLSANAAVAHLDQNADSWEYVSGTVSQSIQIGTSTDGAFILGTAIPD